MHKFTGLILAAGKGTRMGSDLPKVVHKVGGKPMAARVIDALRGAGCDQVIVVIGHEGELVQSILGSDGLLYEWQRDPQGTGHAVLQALKALPESGPVVIAPGDAPLIPAEAYRQLVEEYNRGSGLVLGTVHMANPFGYGRIVEVDGEVKRVVEEKNADPLEKRITEVNLSLYCVDAKLLTEFVPLIQQTPPKNEYYLTDIVEMAAAKGVKIGKVVFDDPEIYMGVNDRWSLLQAEKALRLQILKKHVDSGVILSDIDTTFIGPDVRIAAGAVIEPCTTLSGETIIGPDCRIGPYTIIDDSTVGAGSLIYLSRISEAIVGQNCKIGPFANLRPGANLGNEVKIGNFVEVKKSKLDDRVSASHLSYIGDASIGANTNIGAGTITCNYDGFVKSKTIIGSDVFVGSNSTLIAPLEIGDNGFIAAGSVINKNVPAEAMAIGRGRQENKEGWVTHWRKQKKG